eukprot:scaffold1318_cov388-Prasinococcus_capsulatus_cf.AAC.67
MQACDLTGSVAALAQGIIFGLLSILIVTPLLAFGLVELPFAQKEFAVGLAVFASMPTTLSSGAALVAQASGNFALALLLTVSTNVLAVFSIPFVISLTLGSSGDGVRIDPVPLLLKLLYSILAPLALGKLSQMAQRVSEFVKKHKKRLSIVSNTFLIMVPWMTVSKYSDDLKNTKFTAILLILVAAVCIHSIYLVGAPECLWLETPAPALTKFMAWLQAFNAACLAALRTPFDAYKAVLLVTSQKTLPVAITVISFLDPDEVGSPGLVSIPPILCHLTQIVIDSVIVARYGRVGCR